VGIIWDYYGTSFGIIVDNKFGISGNLMGLNWELNGNEMRLGWEWAGLFKQ